MDLARVDLLALGVQGYGDVVAAILSVPRFPARLRCLVTAYSPSGLSLTDRPNT
jgi:hypothetical protein